MFKNFADLIRRQFRQMSNQTLFVVDVERDELWDVYINAFPTGTDPIYRINTEHTCSCCRQFIRNIGHVVIINDDLTLTSIWDAVNLPPPYDMVAMALSEVVKSRPIKDIFIHYESRVGVVENKEYTDDNRVIAYNHFVVDIPVQYLEAKDKIDGKKGNARTDKTLFERAMKEITLDAAETVLDLIAQNSLYRGEEYQARVKSFTVNKAVFNNVAQNKQDIFFWRQSLHIGDARIRNTVIGTLLDDLSKGEDLNRAVTAYERMVAPTNYKRPTALVTPRMVEDAKKKVEELGLEAALHRRYAVLDDITINNVIYADRAVKKTMGVFDELIKVTPTSSKSFDHVEEIGIEAFIKGVLPTANQIDLLVENKHENNFVSLIAPSEGSGKIFQWDNNFSWSYNGEVTDSIKERVKKAGGSVDGYLRVSLSWYNFDDLDLHVHTPMNSHIYFRNRTDGFTMGQLDVDENAGEGRTRTPVENITWPFKNRLAPGKYKVRVNNYRKRENKDEGFEIEIECNGETHNLKYSTAVRDESTVDVAEITVDNNRNITVKPFIASQNQSKSIWNVQTQTFVRVDTIMNSPNHWDDQAVGNRHWFFMLEGCRNELPTRGFYNEFLRNDLTQHRKVFEVLGSKLKVEPSDHQLSGLGFSSTKRDSVVVRVKSNIDRVLKIKF